MTELKTDLPNNELADLEAIFIQHKLNGGKLTADYISLIAHTYGYSVEHAFNIVARVNSLFEER